jgi:hypothetical protein
MGDVFSSDSDPNEVNTGRVCGRGPLPSLAQVMWHVLKLKTVGGWHGSGRIVVRVMVRKKKSEDHPHEGVMSVVILRHMFMCKPVTYNNYFFFLTSDPYAWTHVINL